MADWLQGPYVYALYKSYGYNESTIEALFVVGFGSSALLGTCIGGWADVIGRKRATLLYCFVYIACCATKHFDSLPLLVLGRALGGIATSLLFSVLESWLVHEHSKLNFENDLFSRRSLSKTLSLAQCGNSLVAILAGQLAQAAVSFTPLTPLTALTPHNTTDESDLIRFWYGGDILPFDLSAIVLLVCAACVSCLWDENYGGHGQKRGLSIGGTSKSPSESPLGTSLLLDIPAAAAAPTTALSRWRAAFIDVLSNRSVLLLGITSACFESSMYIFVILWTPALSPSSSSVSLPCGLIFSTFMVCCMAGSCVYSLIATHARDWSLHALAFGMFLAGAALSVPVWAPQHQDFKLAAFLLFEIVVGFYYPAMGTLKSAAVGNKNRASVYNIFRIPLNIIVCCVLLAQINSLRVKFAISVCLLLISTVSSCLLVIGGGIEGVAVDDEEEVEKEKETVVVVVGREHQPMGLLF